MEFRDILNGMKRISLLSRKGGVAKTLSAMALAQVLCEHGRVAVLDLDPEGSASSWARMAKERGVDLGFEVYDPVSGSSMSELDYLVVDTPPNDAKLLLTAAKHSDVIFVPLQPGQGEIDRLEPTLDVLRDHAKELQPGVRMGILLTMAEHDRLSAAMPGALEQLGYPLVGIVRKSVEYRRAFGDVLRPDLRIPFEEALVHTGVLTEGVSVENAGLLAEVRA